MKNEKFYINSMIFPFILSCKPRLIKIQFISASLCGIVHCFESVRWTFFKIGFNRFGQCHETSCIINTILNKFQILSFHCFHFYQPLSFTPFLSHLRRSSNPRFLDRCLLLTTERCVIITSSVGSVILLPLYHNFIQFYRCFLTFTTA